MLGRTGQAALGSVVLTPLIQGAILSCASAAETGLKGVAGIDRVTILPGKTYLRGWAGYGDPPRSNQNRGRQDTPPRALDGPAHTAIWTKDSGPGEVKFDDATALITTATFSTPGAYVLRLTVDNGQSKDSSTLNVSAETPPPGKQLDAVYTKNFKIDSPLWNARAKALMVSWIPHCIDQINRTDLTQGPGGIDNFVEAGKALRGEPHGAHKGYVFSNAWVHQTVEAMSIALMIDPQGDAEIIQAHERMRATLEDWIPKILAAQEPDGYLQTAFTLPRVEQRGTIDRGPFAHWERRGDHEGYTAGYFLESAINHYLMTNKKDGRLYNAARKLADCWYANLGPAPKKAWYDGHQEMEQALVRFGRFVNDMEGGGKGTKYVELAKFLLDGRYNAARNDRERNEYDQSHLPVTQQYEAVGHAVRAMYNYSGMADVAVETHDPDYQSAVKSLWDNMVNKKYYVTGGVGSGETSLAPGHRGSPGTERGTRSSSRPCRRPAGTRSCTPCTPGRGRGCHAAARHPARRPDRAATARAPARWRDRACCAPPRAWPCTTGTSPPSIPCGRRRCSCTCRRRRACRRWRRTRAAWIAVAPPAMPRRGCSPSSGARRRSCPGSSGPPGRRAA